jgi:hypothetical protein
MMFASVEFRHVEAFLHQVDLLLATRVLELLQSRDGDRNSRLLQRELRG